MNIIRWANYIRYVPPSKILGRILYGFRRSIFLKMPGFYIKAPPSALSVDVESLRAFTEVWKCTGKRFAKLKGLEEGRFYTKGVGVEFNSISRMDWTPPFRDIPQNSNWSYDFASFAYAVVLVERDAQHGVTLLDQMIQTLWSKHKIGRGKLHFVWNPISVSLRIMSLLAAISVAIHNDVAVDDERIRRLLQHVYYCASYLDVFAERYLGYNHEAFALVAISTARKVFCELEAANSNFTEAVQSIERQVLADGFQAERTATYHIHVLLLCLVLDSLSSGTNDEQARLKRVIERMRFALDAVVHPDGEIALFNDCAIDDSVPPADVGWVKKNITKEKLILPEAGFGKLRINDNVVIFDFGKLGADDVIGHAHADFLSCEISQDSRRIVVDPGVFAYSAGALRDATRSSQSHNGPTFTEFEPAEFFGAWRVGKRGLAHLANEICPNNRELELAGRAEGYEGQGFSVFRHVALDERGAWVVDIWEPISGATPRLRLLIATEWSAIITQNGVALTSAGIKKTITTTGQVSTCAPARWCPKGAMIPQAATEIIITPQKIDGLYVSSFFLGALGSQVDEDLSSLEDDFRRKVLTTLVH